MNCREARQLFSPWVDRKVTDNEAQQLQEHVAECALCAAEIAGWEMIGSALREMKVPVSPPEDLAKNVIARLTTADMASRSGFRSWMAGHIYPGWWQQWDMRWKKGLAVAAAFIVILSSSAGIAARYIWPSGAVKPPGILAENKPAQPEKNTTIEKPSMPPDNKQPATDPENQNKDNLSSHPVDNIRPVPDEKGKTIPENKIQKNNEEAVSKIQEPVSITKKPEVIASNTDNSNIQTPEPKVFLNRPRTVESLLLKVRVVNLDNASAQVISRAKAGNFSYQDIPRQQVDGRMVDIYRLVVPQSRAEQFSAFVAALGQVFDQQREVRDISSEFSEKLERYQSLITERKTTTGHQARELDIKIKELEQELTTWDRETRDQIVIIVWLEE